MNSNHWSEFEYSKHKLLLHGNKMAQIYAVLKGEREYDFYPPISIDLHLTNLCNLNCEWCTDKSLKVLKVSNKKSNILKLFQYCASNGVGITIEGGGEPSLHPDFYEIVRHGSNMGLSMGLISNGVLDFSDIVCNFNWIRISIDASTREQYKVEKGRDLFNKVLDNLRKFNERRSPEKTHLGVGYVLTTRNISHILELIIDMDKNGIDYIYIRPVEEAIDITPSVDELLELKAKIIKISAQLRLKPMLVIHDRYIINNDQLPCVAHSLSTVIRASGEVMLCEKRRHDPIVLGNISESSFEDIWLSEKRRSVTKRLLSPKEQDGCNVCRVTSFNQIFCKTNVIHTKHFI